MNIFELLFSFLLSFFSVFGGGITSPTPTPAPEDNIFDPSPTPMPTNLRTTASPVNTGPSPTPSPVNNGQSPTPSPVNNGPSPTPSPVSQSPVQPTGNAVDGGLSFFTADFGALQGGSCEYLSDTSTANGQAWNEPYGLKGFVCAANAALYQGGAACGKCFKITFSGEGGSDPTERGGEAVIQITDSGADEEFDCFGDAFFALTGIQTGLFPIEYEPVECEETGLTAVILDGNNAFFTKVLFAGGKTAVVGATITVGDKTTTMSRNSGATWRVDLDGTTNVPVSFTVNFDDGTTGTINNTCFAGSWPVPTSSQCTAA